MFLQGGRPRVDHVTGPYTYTCCAERGVSCHVERGTTLQPEVGTKRVHKGCVSAVGLIEYVVATAVSSVVVFQSNPAELSGLCNCNCATPGTVETLGSHSCAPPRRQRGSGMYNIAPAPAPAPAPRCRQLGPPAATVNRLDEQLPVARPGNCGIAPLTCGYRKSARRVLTPQATLYECNCI